MGDGASWEDKIPLARGWRSQDPPKAALGSGPAAARPRPFPVLSPSLPADGAVQRCPAGSLPWAGYTSDTQRAGSSKHPPTGSTDCHGMPNGECPGDPLHTSSVRALGKCSTAVPTVSWLSLGLTPCLPPLALALCSALAPARYRQRGPRLAREGARTGDSGICPRGRSVGGSQPEGQTPGEAAGIQEGLAGPGQRGLRRGAGPCLRHLTPAPPGNGSGHLETVTSSGQRVRGSVPALPSPGPSYRGPG